MLQFTELRITNDSKSLVIGADVTIDGTESYTQLDEVIIDTEETYVDGAPSGTPLYTFVPTSTTSFIITLNASQLGLTDFKGHMFFVYLKSLSHKEGVGIQTELGVTLDMASIYNTFMAYINEVGVSCSVPVNFIDWYLKFKALKIASNAGYHLKAIDIYNKYFKNPILLC